MNAFTDDPNDRPDLKAFLIIDMQCCSLAHAPFGVPDIEPVVENCNMAIAACRAAGVPIIFTRHRQQKTFIGLGGTSVADDFRSQGGVELIPEVDYRPDEDQCFDKQHWSAFRNTDLEDRLSVLPGSQVAVAGTVTDGCVLTTAYDAFFRQLPVILIEDAIGACGDGPHMSAIVSMANWLYGSRITSASAFAGWLAGGEFDGWKWTRGNEFPFTVDSLRADYERLVGRSAVPAQAAT